MCEVAQLKRLSALMGWVVFEEEDSHAVRSSALPRYTSGTTSKNMHFLRSMLLSGRKEADRDLAVSMLEQSVATGLGLMR